MITGSTDDLNQTLFQFLGDKFQHILLQVHFYNSGKTMWKDKTPHYQVLNRRQIRIQIMHAGSIADTSEHTRTPSLSNERHKGGRTFLRSRGRGGCRTCGIRERHKQEDVFSVLQLHTQGIANRIGSVMSQQKPLNGSRRY